MNTSIKKAINFTKRGIHFLYDTRLKPRSIVEDDRRKEFILNIILVGVIILLTWSNLYILIDTISKGIHHQGISFEVFSIFTIFFFCLYILSRKGFFNIASYVLIVLFYFGATYSAYRWGPNLPAALLGYALVIVISSILISTKFSFIVGICTFAAIFILGYLEYSQHILPETHWKNEVFVMGDAVQYSLLLFVVLIVSWLSNREIEKSLARARASELELIKERDLLEIKVEERTKELKLVQLEKMSQLYRFAEFGRLSSGIFHDLINPLHALSLNISRLQSIQKEKLPEIEPYVEKAISASKKMEHFILAVRKQIHTQDEYSEFELNKEIDEAISILEHKARKANVSLKFSAPTQVSLNNNPLKFHQIATNLISNAIDSYDILPLPKIPFIVQVKLDTDNHNIYLQVQDNGSGIHNHIQEKIFDPFFTTKSVQKGSGLGLSTTKHIVEKDFKGSITVSSTVGEGTLFTVIIPRNH